MFDSITVSPAYGRDYRSRDAAEQAWKDGKDFLNQSPFVRGRYVNRQDVLEFTPHVQYVHIRYNRMRDVTIIKVKGTWRRWQN